MPKVFTIIPAFGNLNRLLLGVCTLLFFVSSPHIFSQEKRIARLPSSLKEISGLVAINDSILIAINDGGNAPEIHVLDTAGNYIKSITIYNATNIDWEDLAYDRSSKTLYIGDVGNNLNKRKNLSVYAVSLKTTSVDSLNAKKIAVQFPNQSAFPPKDSVLLYDCEAMTFHKKALYFITKCNDKPYTGRFFMYRLDLNSYKVELCYSGTLGSKGYFYNSITGMDNHNNTFIITTYAGVYSFRLTVKNQLELIKSTKYKRITQKEAICYYKNHLYIADEKVPVLLGPNLYKMNFHL